MSLLAHLPLARKADRDRALMDARLAAGDLASLRDQLAAETSSAADAGSTARQMAARLSAAERAAAAAQEERERAAVAAEEAEAAAAAARGREEEARAQGREWAERARRAEALVAEYEADVAQVSAAGVELLRSYNRLALLSRMCPLAAMSRVWHGVPTPSYAPTQSCARPVTRMRRRCALWRTLWRRLGGTWTPGAVRWSS